MKSYRHFTFHTKSSKSRVDFMFTMHLNLDAKLSSDIFDLYVDFLKSAVVRIDSNSKIIPNILKSFPVTKLSISLTLNLIKINKT